MKNFRNTLGNSDELLNQKGKKERISVSPQKRPNSHHKKPEKGKNSELEIRLTRNIRDTLGMKKIFSSSRNSLSTNFSPSQKVFFTTLSNFLNMIDGCFQYEWIDAEFVMQMLNFMGYPHYFTKTVFQSLGATHTWLQCLQMMDFFSDIVQYHLEYDKKTNQFEHQKKFIDYVLQSFVLGDSSFLEKYLQNKLLTKMKEKDIISERMNISSLTLKNIKNSQRSMEEMIEEEEKARQVLKKETQIVIELDQSSVLLTEEIKNVEEKIEQEKFKLNFLNKKIVNLQKEEKNQELTVQEAKKYEADIKCFTLGMMKLEEKSEEKKRERENQRKRNHKAFIELVEEMKQIRKSIQENYEFLEERNIDIPIIEINPNLLNEYEMEESPEVFVEKLEQVFQTEKIKKMLISQEFVRNLLKIENKRLENERREVQAEIAREDTELKQLLRENEEKQNIYHEKSAEVNELKIKTKVLYENISMKETDFEQLLDLLNKKNQKYKKIKEKLEEGKAEVHKKLQDGKEQEKKVDETLREIEKQQQKMIERLQKGAQRLMNSLINVNAELKNWQNLLMEDKI